MNLMLLTCKCKHANIDSVANLLRQAQVKLPSTVTTASIILAPDINYQSLSHSFTHPKLTIEWVSEQLLDSTSAVSTNRLYSAIHIKLSTFGETYI